MLIVTTKWHIDVWEICFHSKHEDPNNASKYSNRLVDFEELNISWKDNAIKFVLITSQWANTCSEATMNTMGKFPLPFIFLSVAICTGTCWIDFRMFFLFWPSFASWKIPAQSSNKDLMTANRPGVTDFIATLSLHF